jgi:HlyD family secretion protein
MEQERSNNLRISGRLPIAGRIATALAVTIISLAAIGTESWLSAQEASTGHAPVGDVHALARLEPGSGFIVVGARPGARIERILVTHDDPVRSGQVLAVLEGNELARAQLALAEAQKVQVEHQRSLKKQKLALEREQFDKMQKVKLDAATRIATLSNQRFQAVTVLYKTLGATLQGKDKLEADQRYFEFEVQNMKAQVEKDLLEIAQQVVPKQRKLEDDELAENTPDLEVVNRQVDLARVGVAQTEVRAPIGGRILELMAKAGEVSSGPLLGLGDVSVMVATAEVFQSDIPRLKAGDAATVQILDQTQSGKVTRIGSVVGKNQLTSLDPRALQDLRVAKVIVSLDDASVARRFVGMEVEVAIKVSGGSLGGGSPRSAAR